jgi:hypothetical protein
MRGVSRILLLVTLLAGFAVASAPQADAGVFVRRVAPVRRIAARAVLPPYPVARRVAYGPVYRPYVRPYGYGYWARPVVYGPGVVVVGF